MSKFIIGSSSIDTFHLTGSSYFTGSIYFSGSTTISGSALRIHGSASDGARSELVAANLSNGVGVANSWYTNDAGYPLQIVNRNRVDAANVVAIYSDWDTGNALAPAGIVHSFGWTEPGDTYQELASVRGGGFHVSGSEYVSSDIYAQGYQNVKFGNAPGGSSGSYGVGTDVKHMMDPFVVYATPANQFAGTAIEMVADINSASLHDEMRLVKIGWIDNSNIHTTSWIFKPYSIETGDDSTAEIMGSEADGGAAIGVILGSSASYATAGAKLVSVQNNGLERENIYHDGTKVFCETNYGSYLKETYFENLVSITGSLVNLYFTSDQVPAGASISGVGARVYSTFHTSSGCWWAVGMSGSTTGFTEYWGDRMSVNAGVTNETGSLKNGLSLTGSYLSEDTSICVSSSVLQANITSGATGSVRVVCFYRTLGALTG